MNKFLEETAFLSTMWKKLRKKDTDEVVIEFFEKEIKEKLSANDIDRSHQLGKKQNGSRPSPIIIKFTKFNVCNVTLLVQQRIWLKGEQLRWK